MQKPRSLKGLFLVAATALVLGLVPLPSAAEPLSLTVVHVCYSARRFDADRRANPLRFFDSGGSNFCAE